MGQPSTSQSQQVPTGFTNKPRPLSLIAILLVVIVGAAACWLAGVVQREGLDNILKRIASPYPSAPKLVESHSDVMLMYEQQAEGGRVTALKSGQASWLLVSGDDTSATGASLSPDGKWVAYVTRLNGGQVRVVSLTDNANLEINQQNIQDADPVAKSESLKVCPWTSTAWEPNNQRITFFGCSQTRTYSTVVVASIPSLSLALAANADSPFANPRQASWLNAQQIVITTPISDTQHGMTVQTISAP